MPAADERAVFARIAWRIMPVLLLSYIVNFLDRINVGFAALTMNQAIGLTAAQFGLGAGILFIGYCVFEIPSNVALYHVGARRWIARIMITWGLVSAGAVLVTSANGFYAQRLLLGIAEAGFFPGVTYYLARWFPAEYRARILAWLLLGVPASAMIGSPVSGMLLGLDGTWGLAGWQWLFLMEGLPAVILGFVVLRVLPDTPEDATWLSPAERAMVASRVQGERRERESHGFWSSLRDPRVLLLGAVQCGFIIGAYGVGIFLPQIIKQQHYSNAVVGWVTALPNLAACVGTIAWAALVDRRGGKTFHLALACVASAAGLVLAVWTSSFVVAMLGMTVAVVGTNAARAIFWTIPTAFLTGLGAAGGLALINSIGTLGGFVGPSVMGWLKDETGSFSAGLVALSGFLVLSAVLVACLKLLMRRI
jgi:MFS family permease